MGIKDTGTLVAAIIFLCIYVVYVGFAVVPVMRKGLKNIYTFLLVFGIIRIGAQVCGIGFSCTGLLESSGVNWLISFLILTNQGYFFLILTSIYFLFHAEVLMYGYSVYQPTKHQVNERSLGNPGMKRIVMFTSPSGLLHLILVPANIMSIVGVVLVAQIDPSNYADNLGTINTATILRKVGSIMFMVVNLGIFFIALHLIHKRKVKSFMAIGVLCAWPWLCVRGVYAILACFLPSFNYFNIADNYSSGDVSTTVLISEYVLGTTMELFCSTFILCTYYFRNENKGPDPKEISGQNIEAAYPMFNLRKVRF